MKAHKLKIVDDTKAVALHSQLCATAAAAAFSLTSSTHATTSSLVSAAIKSSASSTQIFARMRNVFAALEANDETVPKPAESALIVEAGAPPYSEARAAIVEAQSESVRVTRYSVHITPVTSTALDAPTVACGGNAAALMPSGAVKIGVTGPRASFDVSSAMELCISPALAK